MASLCSVALLLAVTTGRNADQVALPGRAGVSAALVATHAPAPALADAREEAARRAVARLNGGTSRGQNRFEPEAAINSRSQVAVVGEAGHRGFDGPMWRFLLNEPVRPNIDLTHNQVYYGVTVTLPFGG